MKTNVSTKLGWSKLVLAAAVLAVVAMVSVIGLCFTNANADDTADPANAEINIPVSILNPEPKILAGSTWASTPEWAPKRGQHYTNPTYFDKHTYTITDNTYPWFDESATYSDAEVAINNDLIITLGTVVDGKILYKSWKITCGGQVKQWWVVFNGKSMGLNAGQTFPLNSNIAYSFFSDQVQTFNITDNTKDANKVKVEAQDFDKKQITYEAPISQLFTLNSRADFGNVYYNPESPYDLYLTFANKYKESSTYKLTLKVKFSDVDYFWTYDGSKISTDAQNPTTIKPFEMSKIPFTFEKNESPKPEPITDFKVIGTIVDKDGKPIPNATVGFYNSEMDTDVEEPMVSALTDENGHFVLEGCSTGVKDPESGLKITYTAKHYVMDEFPFDYEDIIGREVTLTNIPVLEPAILDLYSDSPQHKSFTVTATDQEEIIFCRNVEYYGISEFESNALDNTEFNILDNGVLYASATDSEGDTSTLTIVPNAQDGYIFDNYVINDKTTYRVGDTVDIMQIVKEDSQAKINTNYVADTSKIAQTSDENIYAVVAIIAIVATVGTLLVLRRRKLDF